MYVYYLPIYITCNLRLKVYGVTPKLEPKSKFVLNTLISYWRGEESGGEQFAQSLFK